MGSVLISPVQDGVFILVEVSFCMSTRMTIIVTCTTKIKHCLLRKILYVYIKHFSFMIQLLNVDKKLISPGMRYSYNSSKINVCNQTKYVY